MTDEPTLAELRRRADVGEDVSDESRRWEANHPARTAVFTYLDALFRLTRPKRGAIETRRDRERAAAWFRLSDSLRAFGNVTVDAPLDVENFLFGSLLEIMQATFDIGGLLVPDIPRAGRDAQRERALQKKVILTQAIQMYLAETKPENASYVVEQKPFNVTEDFAADIRPAILDALGLPEDASYKVWPTLSAIKKALSAINNGSF